MTEFFNFASNAPFTAFFITFLFVYGITYPLRAAVRAYACRERSRRILTHGWPPAHIDADGDFNSETDR